MIGLEKQRMWQSYYFYLRFRQLKRRTPLALENAVDEDPVFPVAREVKVPVRIVERDLHVPERKDPLS
jgi:hypothetical protein